MLFLIGVLLTVASLVPSVRGQNSIYSLDTIIPWTPLEAKSVDQSVVVNDIYYVSDRTNKGVQVYSLLNNSHVTVVTGFQTTIVNGSIVHPQSGPNGLVAIPNLNELWAGAGDSAIKVIDLSTNQIVANISTGGYFRADEGCYGQANGIAVWANPDEDQPFVSIVSTANRTVLGRITFTNASGIEQTAFNVIDGLFYSSVPSSDAYPGGAIFKLDIENFTIGSVITLPDCEPAGIAFGPDNQLFVGCSEDQLTDYGYEASYVIDAASGAIVANISGLSGIDQVVYDAGTNFYYASAYLEVDLSTGASTPNLAIVNASSNLLIQSIVTDNVTAHSVAVDNKTKNVMVPVSAKGVVVYQLSTGSGATNANGSGSANATSTTTAPFAYFTSDGSSDVVPSRLTMMSVLTGLAFLLVSL